VALAAGRRGSGGILAGAAAGPVGEGPGRSPSPPRSGWAPEFGLGNRRRAAHRQPGVAAAAAVQCPARAARWGGGARRRASTSAREGDGCFSWGKPPVGLGARRGGLPWRWWAVRLAAGRSAVALSSRSGSGSVASK
jgi:hypothetical protein